MPVRLLPEGVYSQWLGPLVEWVPSHTEEEFRETNDPFWDIVLELIKSEPGDEPDWMSETGMEMLALNDDE